MFKWIKDLFKKEEKPKAGLTMKYMPLDARRSARATPAVRRAYAPTRSLSGGSTTQDNPDLLTTLMIVDALTDDNVRRETRDPVSVETCVHTPSYESSYSSSSSSDYSSSSSCDSGGGGGGGGGD